MDDRLPKSPPREDQRVRLTKTLLQNAFLQLLAQKPVQSVTVKELCQLAGVNRGTFYLHYTDVYDLLEQMQQELLKDLDALLDSTPVIVAGQAPAGFTASMLAFFEKNHDMCAILLGDNGDKKFVAAIIERAKEKSVKEYLERFPKAGRRAELFYYFIAWGVIGLIQHRLQRPGGFAFSEIAAGAEQIIAAAALSLEA